MKKIVFTLEEAAAKNLFPFTITRGAQHIRIGITTIGEKWQSALSGMVATAQDAIPANVELYITANVLPDEKLAAAVSNLQPGEQLTGANEMIIAACIAGGQEHKALQPVHYPDAVQQINFPWQAIEQNGKAIAADFTWIVKTKKVQPISATNRLINPEQIFIEEGAVVEHCIINAAAGPVFIAKGAEIMEGSMLRGPLAIGEASVVKMGSKIYGATTIGPNCVVGGEIKNSIFFGYSNKAHDGYLGDSVIGEWCNMGAGTSNSNIKNTASAVRVCLPHGPIEAGLKCGVLMGDYTRTAINTAINTGTVTGICCNIFDAGLTPKYIPSFAWGTAGDRYQLDKALKDIAAWKRLKGESLTADEIDLLQQYFNKGD